MGMLLFYCFRRDVSDIIHYQLKSASLGTTCQTLTSGRKRRKSALQVPPTNFHLDNVGKLVIIHWNRRQHLQGLYPIHIPHGHVEIHKVLVAIIIKINIFPIVINHSPKIGFIWFASCCMLLSSQTGKWVLSGRRIGVPLRNGNKQSKNLAAEDGSWGKAGAQSSSVGSRVTHSANARRAPL